jgi:5-methyltetrahydropteroyltriglutamate--homocysteine methyltransferase
MKRSDDRILVTHAGALPKPDDVRQMLAARTNNQPVEAGEFAGRVRASVSEVVQQQLSSGIDIINDGEIGKSSFSNYARERLSGVEDRDDPEASARFIGISGRDMKEFPGYFADTSAHSGAALYRRQIGASQRHVFCNGPLKYIGQETLRADVENFRAALQGANPEETFLPAVAPGTIEHWLRNEYYASDEAYLNAIADAMHEEYKGIVDAGFILQIDDPDLADAWQMHPDMDVPAYRKFAELRIDALNHALRGIPTDRVRFHMCWGSYHGPHKYDIPLRDIVDIILKVNAEAYSIEASNPCHEHEWRVWEEKKLPDGRILIPGVVGHFSDFIEHPQLVADRLVRYASLVGRENLMAGTDCGLGGRVGHPSIVWAKFQAMAQGAELASEQLWG